MFIKTQYCCEVLLYSHVLFKYIRIRISILKYRCTARLTLEKLNFFSGNCSSLSLFDKLNDSKKVFYIFTDLDKNMAASKQE